MRVIRGWVKRQCIIKNVLWCFTSYTVTLWYYKATITTLMFLSCKLFKSFIDFHESFWHQWSVKKSRSKRQVWLNIWTLSAGRIRWPNSSSTAQISGRASVHALRAPLRQQTIPTSRSVTHTHIRMHTYHKTFMVQSNCNILFDKKCMHIRVTSICGNLLLRLQYLWCSPKLKVMV